MSWEHVEEYLDDRGFRWKIRAVLREGGLDLEVTAPGLEPRILRPDRPKPRCNSSRPSPDDVPLPLENL